MKTAVPIDPIAENLKPENENSEPRHTTPIITFTGIPSLIIPNEKESTPFHLSVPDKGSWGVEDREKPRDPRNSPTPRFCDKEPMDLLALDSPKKKDELKTSPSSSSQPKEVDLASPSKPEVNKSPKGVDPASPSKPEVNKSKEEKVQPFSPQEKKVEFPSTLVPEPTKPVQNKGLAKGFVINTSLLSAKPPGKAPTTEQLLLNFPGTSSKPKDGELNLADILGNPMSNPLTKPKK